MTNKLQSFLLLIFCVAAIFGVAAGDVAAQTGGDKILVAGKTPLKQSDIDKLIEFYEWAFQTEFNSTQKADFQEHTVKEFRINPTESRKTIDDIVTTLPKILAAAEDLQTDTRKNFLAAFLPELQKGTDDNSQMLLSIYETANGTFPKNTSSSEKTEEDRYGTYETVKKVAVGGFAAIVGKWVSGNTGSLTTTTSGVYLGGNASRHSYQFGANGAVEYTGIMNVMTGGCRMQIFRTTKGKATLNGDTLTINWTSGSFSRDDSCSPSKNYKKSLPAETETFKVNFETYYDDKQLCLTGSDKTCFSLDK